MAELDPYRIIRKLADATLPDGSVPFASLRVKCTVRPADESHEATYFSPECRCHGKLWVPEPDVEKACHRIREALGNLDPSEDVVYIYRNVDGWHYDLQGTRIPTGSYSEATLRAGEALLDTLMKEAGV